MADADTGFEWLVTESLSTEDAGFEPLIQNGRKSNRTRPLVTARRRTDPTIHTSWEAFRSAARGY